MSVLAKFYIYEVFLFCHRASTLLAGILIWQHLQSTEVLDRTLLLGSFCALLVILSIRFVLQIYYNLRAHSLCKMTTSRDQDGLLLRLDLARPREVVPGQHVLLTLLSLKHASILQRHPFVICWWDEIDDPDERHIDPSLDSEQREDVTPSQTEVVYTKVVYAMLRPRNGWTKSVCDGDTLKDMSVWLGGPFGSRLDLEKYHTVVLFASGFGIFAQLPFIKRLVEVRRDIVIKTRKIHIVWETEQRYDNVPKWIVNILKKALDRPEVSDLYLLAVTCTKQDRYCLCIDGLQPTDSLDGVSPP